MTTERDRPDKVSGDPERDRDAASDNCVVTDAMLIAGIKAWEVWEDSSDYLVQNLVTSVYHAMIRAGSQDWGCP